MFATGDYARLRYDVLQRYRDTDIPVTYGILIADYNQTETREYILNYLELFDQRSGNKIDFFIPGYEPYGYTSDKQTLHYSGKKYYFSRELFLDFIRQYEETFGSTYSYTPMLILAEHSHIEGRGSRRIIIDLDQEVGGTRKAGNLFNTIFDIAENHVAIEEFSSNLSSTYMRGALLDTITASLDIAVLSQVRERGAAVARYRMR